MVTAGFRKKDGDIRLGAELGIKVTGDRELGIKVTGDRELGIKVTGDRELGIKVTGDRELGIKVTGDRELGIKVTGDRELGIKVTGDRELGIKVTGDRELGIKVTGDRELGIKVTGDRELGIKVTGDRELGIKVTGDRELGIKVTGDRELGIKVTGDRELGIKVTGDRELGIKVTGDRELGIKVTGDRELGIKVTGDRELGIKVTGDRELGIKVTGDRELGIKVTGDRELGIKVTGDRELGIKVTGDRELGIKVTGDRELGIKVTGDRELGIKVTGDRELGIKVTGDRELGIKVTGDRELGIKVTGDRELGIKVTGDRELVCREMDLEVEGILRRLTEALTHGGLAELSTAVQAEWQRVEGVTVHVAVTGPPRAGKSSFVNAALGLKEGQRGAASTAEGAAKPARHGRAGTPGAVFWELPDPEGPGFSAAGYLQSAGGPGKYAGFVVVTATVFAPESAALAAELRRLGAPFCLVRSKIDLDLRSYKAEEFAAGVLRAVTDGGLAGDGGNALPRLFSVCCLEPEKFDFRACVQALQESASPPLRRRALLVALPHLSVKAELKNSLKELVPLSALHACLVGAVPVGHLPYRANLPFLHGEVRRYRSLLGLELADLGRQARLIGRPAFVLADEIGTRAVRQLTAAGLARELARWTAQDVPVAPGNARWIPLLRALPGGQLSGASVARLLDATLEQFTNDAYRVERKIAAVLRGE
uniref:interferon-inducible GTPase 5-like n=1 Tax=Pristiophorus japonicus TaxID=55135 RepID=UPI00398E41D0